MPGIDAEPAHMACFQPRPGKTGCGADPLCWRGHVGFFPGKTTAVCRQAKDAGLMLVKRTCARLVNGAIDPGQWVSPAFSACFFCGQGDGPGAPGFLRSMGTR